MYINPTYVKWMKAADGEYVRQRTGNAWACISDWFDVVITLPNKKRGKLDCDNRIKAPLDWAQKAGIISDDKLVNRLLVEWGEAPLGFRITFAPAEAPISV